MSLRTAFILQTFVSLILIAVACGLLEASEAQSMEDGPGSDLDQEYIYHLRHRDHHCHLPSSAAPSAKPARH
jgi:hypothetical protein